MRSVFWLAGTWLLLALNSPAASPAPSQERFKAISSRLDTGGDLLVVANIEGYLGDLTTNIVQLVTSLPTDSPDAQRARQTVARIPGFMARNGFFGLQGFGASVVPRPDGLNDLKVFWCRDPAARNLPLWRGLVGGDPRPLLSNGFLPPDTVFARTGTGELADLWKMIPAAASEFATPEGRRTFDRQMSNLATNLGVTLDELFRSLGKEGFFSVQLSTTETIEIPLSGDRKVRLPQPSFLIGVAVRDGTLPKALEHSLVRGKMPTVKSQAGDLEITSVNAPVPAPFPLQPSFTVCSNMFLLGSSPAVVSAAVSSFRNRNGLTASAEFRKAFAGMPTANNGIVYLSPRFTRAVTDLQAAAMASSGAGAEGSGAFLRRLFGAAANAQSALVIQNLPEGVLVWGQTSSGAKEMVGSVMVAPVGLMAAIAIPSFVKARTAASSAVCLNNLRILDAAKEQWALEAGAATGAEVDMDGILQYVKGATMPRCPQGGTYTVGPIGTDPRCSIPAHRLPGGR